MRTYVVSTLMVGAVCLLLVATVIQQSVLFFMATTFLLLLFAGKLQAWLALRAVQIRRWAPAMVTVGENVSVRFRVSNRSRFACPWLLLEDRYSDTGWLRDASEPPPVAPPPRSSAETEYAFVPVRRGRYSPESVEVYAGDSLGISWQAKRFEIEGPPLLVLPKPEAVPLDLRTVVGWGVEDSESGLAAGSGIEPRGVREYRAGDSMRHVHWRSTARHRAILVKDFEAGGLSDVVLILDTYSPRTVAVDPAFEQAIRNLAFVARELVRIGAGVAMIGQGIEGACTEVRRGKHQYGTILEALALAKQQPLVRLDEFLGTGHEVSPNSCVFLFTSDITAASECVYRLGPPRVTVYLYAGQSSLTRFGRETSARGSESIRQTFGRATGVGSDPYPDEVQTLRGRGARVVTVKPSRGEVGMRK